MQQFPGVYIEPAMFAEIDQPLDSYRLMGPGLGHDMPAFKAAVQSFEQQVIQKFQDVEVRMKAFERRLAYLEHCRSVRMQDSVPSLMQRSVSENSTADPAQSFVVQDAAHEAELNHRRTTDVALYDVLPKSVSFTDCASPAHQEHAFTVESARQRGDLGEENKRSLAAVDVTSAADDFTARLALLEDKMSVTIQDAIPSLKKELEDKMSENALLAKKVLADRNKSASFASSRSRVDLLGREGSRKSEFGMGFANSVKAARKSLSDAYLRMVPNFYRVENETGDGFDTTNWRVERGVSFFVICIIMMAILAIAIHAVQQEFLSTKQKAKPSFDTYRHITSQPSLLGKPTCPCSQPAMPVGISHGGFMPNLTYSLDSQCGNVEEPSGAKDIHTPSPTLDDFTDLHGNRRRGKSANSDAGKPLYGCNKRATNMLNNYSFPLNENQKLTTPWVQCASAHAIFIVLLWKIETLCDLAVSVHQATVRDYLQSFYVTSFLEDSATLLKSVHSDVLSTAANGGRLFAAAAANSEALLLDKIQTLTQIRDHFLEPVVHSSRYSIDVRSCSNMYFGMDKNKSSLAHAVRECGELGYWTSMCCNDANTRCSRKAIKLTCSHEMNILYQRLQKSGFGTFKEAAEAGFLSGMGANKFNKRMQILNGNAEESFPKARNESIGYYPTDVHGPKLYRSYFDVCRPSLCQYTYRRDRMAGFVVLFAGLIGGVVASVKACGAAAVLVLYFCHQSRSNLLNCCRGMFCMSIE